MTYMNPLNLNFSKHFSVFGYPDETLFLVFDILLYVENSLSNLMARMLSLLTFCTQSLHWRNASTNADTKQSKAVNSSFPCVFNRIALAKAASGFIMLDEILSRTEISSLTVKLLVDCRMEVDPWTSLSKSVSSKLTVMKWWNIQNNSSTWGSRASPILQGARLVSPPFLIDALFYTKYLNYFRKMLFWNLRQPCYCRHNTLAIAQPSLLISPLILLETHSTQNAIKTTC